MANPEEQTSSEDKKGADPEGSLQGSLAGWVLQVRMQPRHMPTIMIIIFIFIMFQVVAEKPSLSLRRF